MTFLKDFPDQMRIWNFKLLAHHELDGFGGIGEGMAIHVTKDGRRIMWLAHGARRRISPAST